MGVPLRFLDFTGFWIHRVGSTMKHLAAYCLPARKILVNFPAFWVLTQGKVGLFTVLQSASLSLP